MAKDFNNNWIDEHLRFALANACNKSEFQITKEYLTTLKEINLSDMGIDNLNGIEYAINLVSIDLSKNNIRDASKLKSLKKIVNLDLSNNRIEDVNFINSLVKLKTLDLNSNNISSIINLGCLVNLNVINISKNKIKDMSFIKTLRSKDIKIIANEQCVLLKPVCINYGEDYILNSCVRWDEENEVCYDNIQITGKYKELKTDRRPSLLFSISKILIKNILSDCIIKAEFYHEVSFLKSGTLSGVLIQPILIKLTNTAFNMSTLKKDTVNCKIYGKLILEMVNESKSYANENEYNFIKNKIITLIDSNGNKYSSLTNSNGEYEFINLNSGRYTILFPFIHDYKYITPSLYVCNLSESQTIEVNSTLSDK